MAAFVFIVAGQSNAAGLADDPIADPAIVGYAFTRTKIWVAGVWQTLDPAIKAQSHDQAPDTHGIEPYLAYRFEQNYPADTLYIIKCSYAATGLAADPAALDWTPASNELYTILKSSYIIPALASAPLAGGYTPLGFWWMQGENDALTAAMADTYLVNLTNFFACLAADIPATGRFKRLIGRISTSPYWVFSAAVRAAQSAYGMDPYNNADWVDTDYAPLKADHAHYTAQGLLAIAAQLSPKMTWPPLVPVAVLPLLAFSRNPLRPARSLDRIQPRELTAADVPLVYDSLATDDLIELPLRLTTADRTALEFFFLNTARGCSNPFTYTDVGGTIRTVKFNQTALPVKEIAYNSHAVTISLRVQP